MSIFFKLLLLITLFVAVACANEFSKLPDGFNDMQSEFDAYAEEQNQEFEDYKKALEKEYADYKKSLEKFWDNPKLSTKKEWISYSKDKTTRSDIDFEKNTIKVEVVASSPAEARKKLSKQLAFAVEADTKEVIKKDTLQHKVAQLSKKSETPHATVDKKPIISTVIFGTKPTQKKVRSFVQKNVKNIKQRTTKKGVIYSIKVPLPKNTTLKLAKKYENEVLQQSKRFQMPIPLIFAIMQTESYFNPFAKSHIPAYGLMQIVPWTAGKDTYQFIYKQKLEPSATYLYNSKNNIEMGSAYLHILYYRYLRPIKDPQTRLYCTIAAYNTGAGNIAWAFTHHYNVKTAAKKINTMSSEEVYNHLLRNLKYDEPKYYLKRVRKRMNAFNQAYANN